MVEHERNLVREITRLRYRIREVEAENRRLYRIRRYHEGKSRYLEKKVNQLNLRNWLHRTLFGRWCSKCKEEKED